jgi:hypothetical protein
MKTKFYSLLCFGFMLACWRVPATEAIWDDWKALLGDWVGVDSAGKPGKASDGCCSFSLDLQGKVILRKNHAEYPASEDRPAAVHDDWMVLFRRGVAVRAFYYDSEGHEINYAASFDAKEKAWRFLSDPLADTPRYRLTYTQVSPQHLKLKFEVAPPGKPDAFQTYIEAALQKRS